jgi:hypothetical protein
MNFQLGSGGGIRTRDLWVMSPTSCRCSTPRCLGAGGWRVERARRPRLPRGHPRSTLRRWRRARPGSGWDGVESAPLSATRTPTRQPEEVQALSAKHGPPCRRPGGPTGLTASALDHEHGLAPVRCRPSTCRLSTGWSTRGLTSRRSQKAHLGAGFPLRCCQRLSLPNVATQRCRLSDNWHTSGSSSPVLSY